MNILKITLAGSRLTMWRCRVIRKLSLARCVRREKYLRLSFLPMMLVIVLFSAIFVIDTRHSNAELIEIVKITEGDEWHYFKGIQELPRDWNNAALNESNWQRGSSGIGYGTSTNSTVLDDMQGNYLTVYARTEFFIDYPEFVTNMTLSVVCDGPFVAYLNGVEMLRTKTIQISTPEQPMGVADAEPYYVSGFKHELIAGKNILSLQCDNDDINSPTYSFIPVFDIVEKGGAKQ